MMNLKKQGLYIEERSQTKYNGYMEVEHFEALYPDTTRVEEISKLVSLIKEGRSGQLIGVPGSGRSTLLNLLVYNRQLRIRHFKEEQKTVHFILINFSEIRKRPLIDVMKFMFLNLTESLRERKMLVENKAVGDIFREHLKFHDELILFQGFKEAIDYLCLEKNITVVFLFDRFEEYLPNVTAEFFANLRVLRDRAKYKFALIFSIYRPLETFLEPSILADYYEYVAGNIVYLSLADSVATDFRVNYIEKITHKKVSKAILAEIMRITGGTGRLVKLSVEAVLAYGEKHQELAKFLLEQKAIKSALTEMWSVLTPAEQSALKLGKFEEQEIIEYLEKVGLIKDGNVQIPLFEKYLQQKSDQVQNEKVKLVYDVNTNIISKGDEILSDKLTALEFRLLRYLLQHADSIVERDELINIVWEENKSTAGITDQAVDQLIFRLRRKIETDPNNPQYLQTVKGRGFRLIV